MKNNHKEGKMTKFRNSMLASVIGATLTLSACASNQAPAVQSINSGKNGTMNSGSPSNGLGMGGMMGGGLMGAGPSEKSYGVITFERHNGFRVRSIIDENGTSFSDSQTFAYYTGAAPNGLGGLGFASGCFPQVSYLTVGDSGTIRFTRKNKDLFARITVRTRSGKLVPDTSKKPKNSCLNGPLTIEKAKNVSEKIRTQLVPVTPGKEIQVAMGKTTVTIFTDKDFPVDRVPAYPGFSSPETGAFGGATMMGAFGGGMMGSLKR